jgi:hypothetical protein
MEKTMTTNLARRLVKLEARRGAKRSYVIHVSNPKTKAELAELAAAAAKGRKVAVMPHPVASSAEWIRKYGG